MKNEAVTFEDFGHQNGFKYWWATDLMNMLSYNTMDSFKNPLNRAMSACLTINIDIHDNFVKKERLVAGKNVQDYKLSRFACYMVAMNSDVKKVQVARAQAYFAKQAEKINLILEGRKDLERLLSREEVKEGNKILNTAAKAAGVGNRGFGLFTDAGYRGLYNNGLIAIKKHKGINPKHSLLDYMGRTELAANLFRITLTEEKLSNLGYIGERNAMKVHQNVGADVREMVINNTGKAPEDLAPERRLNDVNKELKKANKRLNNTTLFDE